MEQPEIILNLWYVVDDMGFIYSLRARAYLGWGSDAEKLAYLQKLSATDYLIARPFSIPRRYHIQGQAVYHKSALDLLENSAVLFADAIQQLNDELPNQTPFEIPKQPLVCVTPLIGDESGHIRPFSSGVTAI